MDYWLASWTQGRVGSGSFGYWILLQGLGRDSLLVATGYLFFSKSLCLFFKGTRTDADRMFFFTYAWAAWQEGQKQHKVQGCGV